MKIALHGIIENKILFKSFGKCWESGVLGSKLESIQAETINPFVRPKLHDIIHLAAQFRIFPVEVWLLPGKIMQVIGVGQRIIHPGIIIDIEQAIPVGWLSVFGIPPMVIIAVWIASGTAALFKPFMFITAVIHYKVHNQLNTPV